MIYTGNRCNQNQHVHQAANSDYNDELTEISKRKMNTTPLPTPCCAAVDLQVVTARLGGLSKSPPHQTHAA